MLEFRQYATLLDMAGYYVPKNLTWGMSLRDRFKWHDAVNTFF
jgi:hypothetical protein